VRRYGSFTDPIFNCDIAPVALRSLSTSRPCINLPAKDGHTASACTGAVMLGYILEVVQFLAVEFNDGSVGNHAIAAVLVTPPYFYPA